jgi:hypothetical protein
MPHDNIFRVMKVLAFIIGATIFEAVGDAVMRIALHYHVMPGRIVLFALAAVLLTMYGASLNLAPVEFAEATGLYLASLSSRFRWSTICSSASSHPQLSCLVEHYASKIVDTRPRIR